MKPFLNAFTFEPSGFEEVSGPSMTQPEMTLSLKELLNRFTRGGEVATFQPVYNGSGDFDDDPEFEKMDATERLQYAANLKEAIHAHQARVNEVHNDDPPSPPEAKPTESAEAKPEQ